MVFGRGLGAYARSAKSLSGTRDSLRLSRPHNDHFGADRRALIKMHRVLIDHANAARRKALTNGPGFVCAVNAEQGVDIALIKIVRACPQRVLWAARHPKSA